MAYADPQSVDVGAGPVSLPRTGSGLNTGSFKSNDGHTALSVASQYGKRTRRTIRLDHSKIAPDPLISSQDVLYSMSSYIVVDTPLTGFTVAEAKLVVEGLTTLLTASTGAAITKLLGGEN